MSGQNADQVRVGAGTLYVAPLSSPEPGEPNAAWPSAWREVGYTDEGSVFNLGREVEDVEVEEEFLPVRTTTIKHSFKVGFAAAQMTALNLKMILNGGVITTTAGGNTKFAPPDASDEERCMVGWQSDDLDELWIFRKCFASGESELRNRKNADGKRILPVEFNVEALGVADPWVAYFDDTLAS